MLLAALLLFLGKLKHLQVSFVGGAEPRAAGGTTWGHTRHTSDLVASLYPFSLSPFPCLPFPDSPSLGLFTYPLHSPLSLWRAACHSLAIWKLIVTQRKEHKKGLELIYLYHPFLRPSKPRSLLCKMEMVGLVC